MAQIFPGGYLIFVFLLRTKTQEVGRYSIADFSLMASIFKCQMIFFSEGKSLVHPLQVQYVHQVLQARLADNPTPLTEVYSCLHFFAQSLQLEVCIPHFNYSL